MVDAGFEDRNPLEGNELSVGGVGHGLTRPAHFHTQDGQGVRPVGSISTDNEIAAPNKSY